MNFHDFRDNADIPRGPLLDSKTGEWIFLGDAWIRHLRENGKSARTILTYAAQVRKCTVGTWGDHGVFSPFFKASEFVSQEVRQRRQARQGLTSEQARRVVARAWELARLATERAKRADATDKDRARAERYTDAALAISIIAATGMRQDEVRHLRISEIDRERGVVLVYYGAKGKRPRLVDMPRYLIDLITTLRGHNPGQLVCPTLGAIRTDHGQKLGRVMRQICTELGYTCQRH